MDEKTTSRAMSICFNNKDQRPKAYILFVPIYLITLEKAAGGSGA